MKIKIPVEFKIVDSDDLTPKDVELLFGSITEYSKLQQQIIVDSLTPEIIESIKIVGVAVQCKETKKDETKIEDSSSV